MRQSPAGDVLTPIIDIHRPESKLFMDVFSRHWQNASGTRRQGVAVHIGFDEGRAKMWINEKGRTQVVEFEVSESFLEKVRRTAQPEHGVVRDRTRPWKVDIDFADQYAIPPAMLDELESAIIQGSGKIHPAGGL